VSILIPNIWKISSYLNS